MAAIIPTNMPMNISIAAPPLMRVEVSILPNIATAPAIMRSAAPIPANIPPSFTMEPPFPTLANLLEATIIPISKMMHADTDNNPLAKALSSILPNIATAPAIMRRATPKPVAILPILTMDSFFPVLASRLVAHIIPTISRRSTVTAAIPFNRTPSSMFPNICIAPAINKRAILNLAIMEPNPVIELPRPLDFEARWLIRNAMPTKAANTRPALNMDVPSTSPSILAAIANIISAPDTAIIEIANFVKSAIPILLEMSEESANTPIKIALMANNTPNAGRSRSFGK